LLDLTLLNERPDRSRSVFEPAATCQVWLVVKRETAGRDAPAVVSQSKRKIRDYISPLGGALNWTLKADVMLFICTCLLSEENLITTIGVYHSRFGASRHVLIIVFIVIVRFLDKPTPFGKHGVISSFAPEFSQEYHPDAEGKAPQQSEGETPIHHIDEPFLPAKQVAKQSKDANTQEDTDHKISQKFEEKFFPVHDRLLSTPGNDLSTSIYGFRAKKSPVFCHKDVIKL
jgi:hypothetical protein